MKTWDEFIIPLPFSTVSVTMDNLVLRASRIGRTRNSNPCDRGWRFFCEMKQIDGTLRLRRRFTRKAKQRIGFSRGEDYVPGLAVVLVGDDPASRTYVRSKDKKAAELGLHSVKHELPADTSPDRLIALVRDLNADPLIHGILVQSPLPNPHTRTGVVDTIDPAKDVDGFHPINVAKLAMDDPTGFVPCTPRGCMRLLQEIGVETAGANAVVVGRSMIVGKPMALLLMRRGKAGDATVTVAHSRSRDLAAITRGADIVIAAIGRAHFLGADHVGEAMRSSSTSESTGWKIRVPPEVIVLSATSITRPWRSDAPRSPRCQEESAR